MTPTKPEFTNMIDDNALDSDQQEWIRRKVDQEKIPGAYLFRMKFYQMMIKDLLEERHRRLFMVEMFRSRAAGEVMGAFLPPPPVYFDKEPEMDDLLRLSPTQKKWLSREAVQNGVPEPFLLKLKTYQVMAEDLMEVGDRLRLMINKYQKKEYKGDELRNWEIEERMEKEELARDGQVSPVVQVH